MIAPINVTPPQLQPVDGQQVNLKNINANIQQSNLSVTAANSPDLLAPPSLKKSAPIKTLKISAPSSSRNSNQLARVTPALANLDRTSQPLTIAPLVAQTAATVLPAPSTITVGTVVPVATAETSNTQPTADLPLNPNLAQIEPAPLPPPSEVTPQPPVLTSPLPSGKPPVEPSNYPQSSSVYYNQNYVGPAISFGRNTLVGAVSRFGLGKNISVRPSIYLGNSTRISVPFTYDFGFNDNEQFEKNPLVVLYAGGGLDYRSDNGSNGSQLNPIVVFGADLYLGDGASILVQVGNTFSDFVGTVGVGLQF